MSVWTLQLLWIRSLDIVIVVGLLIRGWAPLRLLARLRRKRRGRVSIRASRGCLRGGSCRGPRCILLRILGILLLSVLIRIWVGIVHRRRLRILPTLLLLLVVLIRVVLRVCLLVWIAWQWLLMIPIY